MLKKAIHSLIILVPPVQINYKLKYKIITKTGYSNAFLKHKLQRTLSNNYSHNLKVNSKMIKS